MLIKILIFEAGIILIALLVLLMIQYHFKKTKQNRDRIPDSSPTNTEKAKYSNYRYTCPMCGSRHIINIDVGKKKILGVLRVSPGKIGKNYQCEHCHYLW